MAGRRAVLITGASGLLGTALMVTLRERFAVHGTYHRHPVHIDQCEIMRMDITRPGKVREVMRQVRPEVVVHCAAETRVDYCEDHHQEALGINATGTANVVKAADEVRAKVVYISTDSVFDGREGQYNERSVPKPLNVYAHSKLLGEYAVQRHGANHLIVRTDLYGWSGGPKQSLAEWILDRVGRGQAVPGFMDIYFSPLLANDLAEILQEMVEADLCGLYHVGGIGRLSKFEFAQAVCRVFGKDSSLVGPISSEGAGLRAPRPKDTSLDVRKITAALGRATPDLLDGVVRFRRLQDEGYVDLLRSSFAVVEASDV